MGVGEVWEGGGRSGGRGQKEKEEKRKMLSPRFEPSGFPKTKSLRGSVNFDTLHEMLTS